MGSGPTPTARELVPGDVIRLRLGDIVPADARLLAGDPVEVDQSALTGESLPATRKPGEAVFSGSIIRQGEIDAMVYATGANTYFGKTAQLVQEAHTVSHFQRAVLKIGDYLIVLAVALVVVIIDRRALPWRPDPHHAGIRLGASGGRDSRGDAHGAVRDHGGRRTSAGEKRSDCDPAVGYRGTGGRGRAVLGQDRHPDPEQADAGRSVHRERYSLPIKVILWAALASRAEDKDTIDLAVIGGVKDDQGAEELSGASFPAVRPGA